LLPELVSLKIPSPVFTARLDHAIWLYQEGKVNSLILTGGRSNGATESDAAIARHYLLNRGVPESVIFIDEQSTVTRENIHNAKIIMTRQNMQTALLVSDPLHMLRMRLIAHDNDIMSWSSPTTTSRYRSWQTQLPFLLRESFYYTGYRILRYLPRIPPENKRRSPAERSSNAPAHLYKKSVFSGKPGYNLADNEAMRERCDASARRLFTDPTLAGHATRNRGGILAGDRRRAATGLLPPQESVAFIPSAQVSQAQRLLATENQYRLTPLQLGDFQRQPVHGYIVARTAS
jgi:hypothetical protein